MADIRPFRGVRYNPSLVKNLARVICPPYDIIPSQMQQELYKRNDFNFIRIEYGRDLPQDRDTDNRYTRAAATLRRWLEQGVLKVDDRPGLYIDDHQFTLRGQTYRRRSLNCLVKLEEWDKMIVRPHEGTLSRPKSDRLNLLWALQADTSPVMALYEDTDNRISSLLKKPAGEKSALEIKLENGEIHRLRVVADAAVTGKVNEYLDGQPLYIADGHHRYESALNYRRERRSSSGAGPSEEPYDFVLMSLIDMADAGLVILPAHRLVRGMASSAIDGLMTGLETCFNVAEIVLDKTNTSAQIDGLLSGGKDEVKVLLYGLRKDRLLVLTVRDFAAACTMMPTFHSELYQKLDVSIVDHVILEELLGLTHEMAGVFLDYSHEALEAIRRVDDQEYQLALIVKPVKPGVIKAIADAGDRMPRKSTYFFPKIPAGLVFYKFG